MSNICCGQIWTNLFASKRVCGLFIRSVDQQLPRPVVMRYYNWENTTRGLQQFEYDIKITPPPAGYHLHFYVKNHSYLRLIFFSRSSSLRSVDFSVFSFCNFLLMRSLIFSLLSESYSSSASPSSMSPSDSSPPWREHVQIYDRCQRRSTDKGSKCLDFALHTSAASPDFFPFFLLMQNYVYLLEQDKSTGRRPKCLKRTSQLEQRTVWDHPSEGRDYFCFFPLVS